MNHKIYRLIKIVKVFVDNTISNICSLGNIYQNVVFDIRIYRFFFIFVALNQDNSYER